VLPGLAGVPAVGYAGSAMVNSFWHFIFGSDSPVALIGGLVYGLSFGLILQCFIAGVATQFIWHYWLCRFATRFKNASGRAKVGLWLGAEGLYVLSLIWALLTTLAYGLAAGVAGLF
jgi:hypothetical protein